MSYCTYCTYCGGDHPTALCPSTYGGSAGTEQQTAATTTRAGNGRRLTKSPELLALQPGSYTHNRGFSRGREWADDEEPAIHETTATAPTAVLDASDAGAMTGSSATMTGMALTAASTGAWADWAAGAFQLGRCANSGGPALAATLALSAKVITAARNMRLR